MNKRKQTAKTKKSNLKNTENQPIETSLTEKKSFRHWFYYIGIFLFTFFLYSNTFQHQWALDDSVVFKDNIYIKQGVKGYADILSTHSMAGIKLKPEAYQYRPLSLLMFATEWQISPDNASLYHIVNVLWYALTCVLLFVVLQQLFKQKSKILSLIITILYAAHPMHTEVVANIKGRDEIIFLFFILSTLWFTMQYIDKQKKTYLIGVFVSFLLAMFSKESAITFLVGVPLTMYFFRKATRKDYISVVSAIVLPIILYLIVRWVVLIDFPTSNVSLMQNYFSGETLLTRWACAIMLLGKYLFLTIIPYQQVCDYSYNQLPVVGFDNLKTIASLFVYVGLLVYAFKGFRKKNVLAYSIFFFVVSISVYSNLVYLIGASFADRFLFVPSLAYSIALGYVLFSYAENKETEPLTENRSKRPLIAAAIFGVVLLFFTVKTYTRSAEWENNFTLYGADIKKSPNSARLNFFWGEALRDKAIEYQEENKGSEFSTPTEMETNNLKYRAYLMNSILAFQKGISIYPRHANAYERLGYVYYSLSPYYTRENFLDSSEKYYAQALSLNPNSLIVNYNIAEAYYFKGDYENSKNHYYKVVSNDPTDYEAYFKLAATYAMLGKMDSAWMYFNTYMQHYPNDVISCYNNLAIGYARKHHLDSAIVMCDKTLEIDPANTNAFQMKIQMLSYQQRFDEALIATDALININPYISTGYAEKANVFQQMNNMDSANFYYELAKSKNIQP